MTEISLQAMQPTSNATLPFDFLSRDGPSPMSPCRGQAEHGVNSFGVVASKEDLRQPGGLEGKHIPGPAPHRSTGLAIGLQKSI